MLSVLIAMFAAVDQLRVIVKHVMERPDKASEGPLQVMMKDQYANYVVRKLIDVADAEEREKMVVIIKTQANHLKKFNFGSGVAHVDILLAKMNNSPKYILREAF